MIRHIQRLLTRVASLFSRKALDRGMNRTSAPDCRASRAVWMRSIRSAATWLMPHGRSPRTGGSRWSASSRSVSAWARWSRSRPSLARSRRRRASSTPNGLTELLVLPLGPLRAKAGVWALEQWSYPDYQALRDTDTGMAITGWIRESSQSGEQTPDEAAPPRVTTLYVSANYFSTFGVSLARGPGFDPAIDDAPSAEPRVVLSDDFWRSRVASDPDIVGKSVTIDGVPHTVVGITPDDFRGHFHFFQAPGSLLFIPLERHPRLRANPNLRDDRTVDWVRIHGRLDPAWTSRRRMRWCRQRSLVWRSGIPRRTNSRRRQSSRTPRWARPVVRSRDA